MPSHPRIFWWLTGVLIGGYTPLNLVYWTKVLNSGVLPTDSDSIGIPIFGSVIVTLVLSPVIIVVSWLCLRRYNPEVTLWAWRSDRPFRSGSLTAIFGSSAAILAYGLVSDLARPEPLPWYEALWIAYFALWLPWLLGLRAAAIDQLKHEPTYSGV